jgi:hypothetical protein
LVVIEAFLFGDPRAELPGRRRRSARFALRLA